MLPVSGEKLREEMANRCRDAYIRERMDYELRMNGRADYSPGPKWDGGEDSQGHRQQAIWPKIADFMLKHQLDPRVCIHLLFRRRYNHANPVMPNQIALDKHLKCFRESAGELRDEIARSFQTERSICFAQLAMYLGGDLTAEEIRSDLLLDETLQLSPLFRHCLAVSCQLTNVAAVYFQAAVAQYSLAMKEYDEVWGEWIYEDFREIAQAAYTAAVKGGKHGSR